MNGRKIFICGLSDFIDKSWQYRWSLAHVTYRAADTDTPIDAISRWSVLNRSHNSSNLPHAYLNSYSSTSTVNVKRYFMFILRVDFVITFKSRFVL